MSKAESGPLCRMSRHGSYKPNVFNRISCMNCYKLLEYVFPEFRYLFNTTDDGYLITEQNQILDPSQPKDIDLVRKTMDIIEYQKWRSCCDEAVDCCYKMSSITNYVEINNTTTMRSPHCDSIWDGWSCHPVTQAGTTSQVKCPSHFISDTCNFILDYAYFKCDSNGSWFKTGYGEWTDYTRCIQSIPPIKQRLINVNIICHSISLVFLIIGLIIFFSYRQLQVNRIKLHKNFFGSLILHSLMQIIWESAIMKQNLDNSAQYIETNHPGCILINLLLQYSRSTNYFWMFCESFYLHRLLISVFKEESNLYLFYSIGWGFPFLLCIIYAISTLILNNQSCWTRNIYLIYILNIPNILTILLNFIFLINIIRVLYKKLTASNTNEPHQYRRAVRATLILVPLFGIHLILSPYVMCESAPGSQIHNLINRLVESLQGFVVALIYCFFNSEITIVVRTNLVQISQEQKETI